ncbi:o-succinylbenzoate synthase [Photobacterium salinisoli]|uniref:o-succinylbenzoate synthase n=1 Tax=Photobacterium salinisoli TaxID=1616783 RepID=UPI000EA05E9C|nr:o-succinylbenzoate synthase [Photobacterium salinisoli]
MTRSARLFRYRLPIDSGIVLRGQQLDERVGYVAQLRDGACVGCGEIAPLVGLSVESSEQAEQQAISLLTNWVGAQDSAEMALYPSVAFGFSMALMCLSGQLPSQVPYHTVPLLSAGSMADTAAMGVLAECRLAKVKVGRVVPGQEAEQVNQLLCRFPHLSLRLDANRAWSLSQAHDFSRHLAPAHISRIVFIEEPCQRPADSLTFSRGTGLALAWDETLQHAARAPDFRLNRLAGAQTLVLKPTLIGSVQRCAQLIGDAQAAGMSVVISSALESSLGLTQLARLSHWLQPESLPGLDTLHLFSAQLEIPWPGSTLPLHSLQQHIQVWQS